MSWLVALGVTNQIHKYICTIHKQYFPIPQYIAFLFLPYINDSKKDNNISIYEQKYVFFSDMPRFAAPPKT